MHGVVGVDPGRTGGIAILSPGFRIAAPLEIKGDRVDGRWLRAWLFEYSAYFDAVWVEQVNAMFKVGASSTFQFGRTLGQIEGVLDSMGLEVHHVLPRKWQEIYAFEKVPVGTPSSVKKQRNVAAFHRTFPGWDLNDGPRAKGPHMGMLDAALIAHWAYSSRGASSSP